MAEILPGDHYYQGGDAYPSEVVQDIAPMVEYGMPYQGQDVGQRIRTICSIAYYSAYDDPQAAGFIAAGTELLIMAYIDADPAITTVPIFLVVADAQKRLYIIEKDDRDPAAGGCYEYVAHKPFPWWLILVAGAVLVVLISSGGKKQKKIAGIALPMQTWLMYAAFLALGYFGVVRPVLIKLGILKSKEQKALEAARREAIADTMEQVLATQKPTYTTVELSNFAEVIYEDLRYSALSDDKEQAGLYLAAPRNEADVYYLIKFFGNRDECYLGVFCYPRSLPEFISTNLSQSKIDQINNNYARKGIKFRW
jgi:hypothetical protein